MRPPKRILMLSDDAPLAFSLNNQTWMRLKRVERSEEVLESLRGPLEPDAIIIDCRNEDAAHFLPYLFRTKIRSQYSPVLAITDSPTHQFSCDAQLPTSVSVLELLERIRVLSVRKRGPRKGSHRKAA